MAEGDLTAATGNSDNEIISLRNTIDETSNQLNSLNERFKKINIVNDQVKTWCHRVYNKFGVLTEDAMFQ
jgi:peptidoglycan hydrolase CwlO-like protein